MTTSLKIASTVTRMVEDSLNKTPILQNSFFTALQNGKMSKEQFIATQQQFYYAVAYFSRPMARLISRMDDPMQRLDILHNIVEEHGEFNPTHFHANTFKKLLTSLGCGIPAEPGPVVTAFNTALMGICTDFPTAVGIACLGSIEYAFSDISAYIGKCVVERRFIEKKNLIHYNLHAALDKEHSQEFFLLLEEAQENPEMQAQTALGLQTGIYIFNRLYEDLYQ